MSAKKADLIKNIAAMQKKALKWHQEDKTIGLVPTMGFLHEGHLALAKTAKKECDIVIMSIFVNPTQFGPNEDYASYPRDLTKDSEAATGAGVDFIFHPEAQEMYPPNYNTFVETLGPTDHLCGADRPGHFKGVATVVSKLFNICLPHKAYFGQKDIQQLTVLRKMVKDLNFPVKIVSVPIIREHDGLALSSRNVRLNQKERAIAPKIHQSIGLVEKAFQAGEKDVTKLKNIVKDNLSYLIKEIPEAKIDYIEIVDAENMQPLNIIDQTAVLALAVSLPSARLIDNTILK